MEQVYGYDVSERYPCVTVGIERIDPETAKLMLERNTRNRTITGNVLNRNRNVLGRAMAQGEWALNGSTIVFDDSGTLLDGQHRLYSCVQSGRAFDTLVVRGVKTTSQVTMDSGRGRTARDQLKIDGMKNSPTMAAAANALLSVYVGGYSAFEQESGIAVATRAEIVDFAESSQLLAGIVRKVNGKKKSSAAPNLMTLQSVAAFTYIACSIDRAIAEAFVDALLNPAGCTTTMALVNQLANNKASSMVSKRVKSYTKAEKRYMLKSAWNAFSTGRDVTRFQRRRPGDSVTEPKGYDQRAFEAFVERDMAGAK